MKKAIKMLFIISVLLSVLFISLYFILRHQAAVCDPVWEIKRHDALVNAANNFLYAFFSTFAIAGATGGPLLISKNKNIKTKTNENKLPNEIKKSDYFEKLMADKDISFFEAVWQYFVSVKAIERFKQAYVSQLQGLNIDVKLAEVKLTLTDKQKEMVKLELNNKIDGIKNGVYDSVFESVFKDEVKLEIEMSNNNNALGGMSPDEYLELLFDSSDGAMFFFDFSVCIENDIPVVKLDIDDGGIDWQPFD